MNKYRLEPFLESVRMDHPPLDDAPARISAQNRGFSLASLRSLGSLKHILTLQRLRIDFVEPAHAHDLILLQTPSNLV